MSADTQDIVISLIQQSKMFTIQIDKSTDVSGKAQLLAFIEFVNNGKISEKFFCFKELKERTTGQDIFDTLNKYLEENGLTWKAGVFNLFHIVAHFSTQGNLTPTSVSKILFPSKLQCFLKKIRSSPRIDLLFPYFSPKIMVISKKKVFIYFHLPVS